MPKVTLTDRFCLAAKTTGQAQTDYFDEVVAGLALRVSSAGTKSWTVHLSRPGDGKRARVSIGRYPELKLGQARQKARELRGKVTEGIDPAAEKKAKAAGATVADLVENYVTRHAANLRSGPDTARRLRKHVAAAIGHMKLADLHRRDLTAVIDAAIDRGTPVEAARLFSAISGMCRWAVARGDLDANPALGMKAPPEPKARDRVLSSEEIGIVWRALATAPMGEGTRRIIRLAFATGLRIGEIAGLRLDEINLEKRTVTVSAERAKNAQASERPICDLAVSIIREQIAASQELARQKHRPPSEYVFPAPGGEGPVTVRSIPHALSRCDTKDNGRDLILGVPAWTVHDARRSFATALQELGVNPMVIAHLLHHVSVTQGVITTRVYARYSFAKEMAEAVDLWGERLGAIISGEGAEVIPLVRATA